MTMECDVLVAGGGMAGIGAAVAAARRGAVTVLAESREFLGGTAVLAMHGMLCGFYAGGPSRPDRPLNEGLATELADRLSRRSASGGPQAVGPAWVLRVAPGALTDVFDELTAAERHLSILTGTRVTGVEVTAGRVGTVALRTPTADLRVSARALVDCTGSGAVLALAGIPQELAPPATRQSAGFVVRIEGISGADTDALPIMVPYALDRAVRAGTLPDYFRISHFVHGAIPGEGYLKLAIPPPADDARTAAARRDATLAHEHLTRVAPEFRYARIAAMSPEVVEREGALMRGVYVLTAEDVLGGRRFDDGVVRNAWPIEFWDQRTGPACAHLRPGDYYEIPRRCLEAPGIMNLYAAGRCISVTRRALASTRVTGPCLSTGEAAAHAALEGTRGAA